MNICISCKNKTTNERCTSKSLLNLQFCGKHARVKEPRIWHAIHNTDKLVLTLQKLWRGYYIRKRLRLAGPGVLKRSLCHNDDELVTAEDKTRQHPFDYFSFEESGKLWWFDIRSLIEWSFQNQSFLNPYTKQPIPIEVRRRFREALRMRIWIDREPITINPLCSIKLEASKWVRLTQEMEENLFTEVNPMTFVALSKFQIWSFINIFRGEFKLWCDEHSSAHSRRLKCSVWIDTYRKNQLTNFSDLGKLSAYLSRLLLGILSYIKDPQHVCFMILSSLYRL